MDIYVASSSSTWKKVTSLFVASGGVWKNVTSAWVASAGVWKKVFPGSLTPSIAATVEISRNNATYPSTLTGTNYSWTNSTSLTYVFQKSSDNVNFTDIGSAASINNPSSSSSNTVTYALTLSDFPAFTSYYRFSVTAVNSTYSTSFTSTSGSVSVSRPAPINTVQPTITPSSGTVGVTEYSVNSNGTWDPVDADGVYDYLWQSYDTPSYVSAPGVNNLSTYTPPSNFLTLGYFSPIRCRVTATNASGSTAAFSSNTATVLGAALTPTFGANTSTAGGFTGSVTNYIASYTWGISTNSGSVSFGTPSGSTYPFTVTGLSSSASATVTVTTSRSGYNSGSAQTTGTATAAPSPPTITSSSATTTSITLNFTLGANSTSTRAYLNGGSSPDGVTAGTSYTFSGLSPGTAYTLALYGYNGVVQSTTSSGGTYSTNTGAALTPTFGSNTSASGGFTGSVTNYNAAYTWGISTNSGSVSFGSPSGSTYPFTVSGLGSGASATVTVTTSRTGYTGGSAQTTGTATTQVPVNTVAPTIAPTSGTAGTTTYSVTSVGSWTNSPTSYAYLWQSFDTPSYISAPGSNTSSSYTPPSNFFTLGYSSPIRCRVTASNSGGAGSAAFSNTATVSAPVVIPSGGTVSISTNTGNYTVGSIITYSTTGWANTPTSYSLRLYNGTSPVLTSDPLRASTSSTSGTYTITSGDVPNYFKAFATASNSAGTSTEASSAQVGPAVAVTTVPGIVTSFTATSSLASTTLSWNATWSAPSSDGGAAITSYKVFVERGSSSSGPWSAATTSISTTAGGTYSGAYTAVSPYSTVNATTPKTIYGRVTSTTSTWIRVYVAAVNSVGTGSTTTAVG